MRAEQVASQLLAEVSTLGHAPRVIGVFRAARPERKLPAARPRALARRRPRQRRHAGPGLRRVRRLPRALARLRRPVRAEGAAGLDRLDLPRAARRLRAAGRGGAGRARCAAAGRARPVALALRARLGARGAAGRRRRGLRGERDDPARRPAESLNVAMAGTIALYEWRRSMELADWIEGYRRAWERTTPTAVTLFTEDASYRSSPFGAEPRHEASARTGAARTQRA